MLSIGQIAPDFSAETTQGPIRFHDWIGDGWAILFSHPKTFTPVCTTELGALAKLQPAFAQRHCKVIGLSVDPVEAHERWSGDIERTQGTRPAFPMIGDGDLKPCPSSTACCPPTRPARRRGVRRPPTLPCAPSSSSARTSASSSRLPTP